MIQTQINRRANPRFQLAVSLRYASYADDAVDRSTVAAAATIDMSTTGMQISSPVKIEVPSFIQVALRLDGESGSACLLAKAMWCSSDPATPGHYRAGLKLLGHVDPIYLDYVDQNGDRWEDESTASPFVSVVRRQ